MDSTESNESPGTRGSHNRQQFIGALANIPMVTIEPGMSSEQMARLIYGMFLIDQSCDVSGFVNHGRDIEELGKEVIDWIWDIYRRGHCTRGTTGAWRRKQKEKPMTVGGTIAHKVFQYHRRVVDGVPRWTIWRIQ